MINLGLQVRRAVKQDYHQIANLSSYESNTHRHLDWRSVLDWVGSPNYWVMEEDGLITATLACPADTPLVAWIRLFAYHPHLSGAEAWSALWKVAYPEIISANPQMQVAAIVVKQWFQKILLASGFAVKQKIVLLQLSGENTKTFHTPQRVRIRPMQESDLNVITEVDLASFGHFWHNTFDSLQRAHLQASHATVAEDDSGVIGYQISTGNPFGAHLARLGVLPEAQGRGVGVALVSDLIQRLNIGRSGSLSVNTQADNVASLSLYKKLGFVQTDEYLPVLVYPAGVS
ncbi:MAG: GNAT family N-acetyltransferase [Anaerolineales bacterium]